MSFKLQKKQHNNWAIKKSTWIVASYAWHHYFLRQCKSSSVNHESFLVTGRSGLLSAVLPFKTEEWNIFLSVCSQWDQNPFILNNRAIVQQQIMSIITFRQLSVRDLGGLWNSIKRGRNRLRFLCRQIPISLLLLFQCEALLLTWPCVTYISLITVHLNLPHFVYSINWEW